MRAEIVTSSGWMADTLDANEDGSTVLVDLPCDVSLYGETLARER